MNPKTLLLAATLAGLLGAAYPAAAEDAPKAAAPGARNPAVKVVKIGMSSDEVRKLLGKPARVEPMEAPEGRAEVWEYRRPLGTTVRQTATGSRRASSYSDGLAFSATTVEEPIYEFEDIAKEEVTQMLFFNDKLVSSKRTIVGRRSQH